MSNYDAPPPSYPDSRSVSSPASSNDFLSQNDVIARLQGQANAAQAAATAAMKASGKHSAKISDAYTSLRNAADSAIRLFRDRNLGTEEIVHNHLLEARKAAPWNTAYGRSRKVEETSFMERAKGFGESAFLAFVLSRQETPFRVPKDASGHGTSFWQCGGKSGEETLRDFGQQLTRISATYGEMTGTWDKSIHLSCTGPD